MSAAVLTGAIREAASGHTPTRAHALGLVLLAAVVLRGVLLLYPVTHHPDEIYQYFEPAYRLLTGDGLQSWEWREHIRGWLLPSLLAGPMAVGKALGGSLDLLLPRIAVIALSLTIVLSASRLGGARSRDHALVAGFVAAIWYSLVCFAPRTLSEPIATALMIPAALWLADPQVRPGRVAGAGALLALAVVARPHYAPAAAVITLVALGGRLPRKVVPLVLGGGLALLAGGLADVAQGEAPLAWVVNNITVNVIQDRASGYGVEPATFYLTHWLAAWNWWSPVILAGFVVGWRASPALAAAALVNLVVHSLIGHKEPRFVFLSEAIVIVLAAIGTVDLGRRIGLSWRVVAAGWAAASILLAAQGPNRDLWLKGHPGHLAFASLRQDAGACGLALVDTSFTDIPGRSHLPPGLPMIQIARSDPRATEPVQDFRPLAAGFNRVLARADTMLPGYRHTVCENDSYDRLCLWARAGGCTARPNAAPWDVQQAMRRSGH